MSTTKNMNDMRISSNITCNQSADVCVNTNDYTNIAKKRKRDDIGIKDALKIIQRNITISVENKFKNTFENQNAMIKCLQKKNSLLEKKIKMYEDEYIAKIPTMNHVYKDRMFLGMGGLQQKDTNTLMRDGRISSHFMKQWIHGRWSINDNLQVKTFTSYGTNLSPSKNIGCSRSLSSSDSKNHINENESWVFVDVCNFPRIRYVFKTNKDVLAIFAKHTSGKVKNFENIVTITN